MKHKEAQNLKENIFMLMRSSNKTGISEHEDEWRLAVAQGADPWPSIKSF